MKSIVAAILIISLSSLAYGQTDFYSKRWSDVYRYELRDLPKSALSVVDTIYSIAKRDKNVPQMVKVLIYQSKFALTLQEDAELVIARKFEEEIKSSKAPLKNILESVLANIYWQYYKDNQWKYYHRSQTTEKVSPDDFRTWDGGAMFREIHNHFQNSLRDERILQGIGLATIHELLEEAENSKVYRPTLYDFIVHNALDFYKYTESFTIETVNGFTFNDARYFDDFEYMSSAPDSLDPQYHALIIFKNALLFHKQAKDTTPYINLEIERLNYLVAIGNFDNGVELHKKALQRLRDTYLGHPISAMIDFELASILLREGSQYVPNKETKNQFKKHEAVLVCNRAIAAFPKSDGAGKCKMLRENILSAKLEITTEDFLPINATARMLVEYANVDSINFFAYKVSDSFIKGFYKNQSDSARLQKISDLKPEITWNAGFTDLKDHQEHKTELIIPAMSSGNYIIVAFVKGEEKKSSQKTYAFQSLQVTNLALLETNFEAFYRYQVVDRVNGKPIVGAKVHFMSDTTRKDAPVFDRNFSTKENGFIDVTKTESVFPRVVATVSYKQDHVTIGNLDIYHYRNNKEEKKGYSARSFIFTDRSIYRPGQTVFFKGILIKQKDRKSSVVTGQYVEVYLDDVNGKEVSSLRLKTNSFGSFSGEFKLPATGLTGEYSIYADEDDEDDSRFYDNLDDYNYEETSISVEEYKRPTFEASFKPIKETFRLMDSVSVTGSALSYSGAKIGGAKVSYHVNRTARFPAWHYWTGRSSNSGEMEIVSGETITNKDGDFTIVFEAEPDEDIQEDEYPVFQYEVTADVTDINGETRSASTMVKVGYHSVLVNINASVQVNRRIQANVISVNSENLNGQFVPTKGTIKIYKLKSPSAPMRPRPWGAPDVQRIPGEEFQKLFPHDPYTDENNSMKPEKGKMMMEANFNTGVSKEVKFNTTRTWQLGSYIIEVNAKDPSGKDITELHRFQVFDPTSAAVPDNQMLVMEADKSSYVVGEYATIKIGSASPDITVVIQVDKKSGGVDTFVEHLSGNFKTITVPIIESMTDGLVIRCSGVNFNSFFSETKNIFVTSVTDKIEIETLSFKDKLQTGSKQTWSFIIKGDEYAVRGTEILASMYDASLDQFKPHEWSFDPGHYGNYYRGFYQNSTNGSSSFGVSNFSVLNLYRAYYNIPRQYYDQLDWFGFSMSGNQAITQRYLDRIYLAGPDTERPAKIMMINSRTGRKGFLTGTVTDNDGVKMPGVNILLKGTTTGTVSNAEGYYEINADKGDVLVFSFVGYTSAEVEVTRKNSVNVQMQPDVAHLSEVVVIGYGVQMKKEMLSAAVGEVFASEATGEVVFEEVGGDIHGKLSGVQISGDGGFFKKVVIRGNSSTSSDALYVVDGVVVESMGIDQMDVASFQVLKGAAATAIYGSRGANGVIIVTTKSGQKKLDEEMSKVNARKNFNETAFFIPHITTNESGEFQFTFTTPEALTRWKLQLLAHTPDLLSATKTLEAVTQKELMVTPNPPRFLRVGDQITFSAKIANLSGRSKDGKAALQLINPVTGESIDNIFKNVNRNQSFKVGAKANTEVSWSLTVPEGVDAIQYKIIAKAGNFSDGEQNALPVLTNRMLVTETMPLYVRAGQTKTFSLDKLKTTTSPSLKHHQLTLEITSNPAWYAIQSLPYLMEYPHECAEQLFSRFYANALAAHIVNSNPTIKQVFDKWAASDELISDLEKNQSLKSIIIEETPWLRDAENESERKKRMAMLFDLNSMSNQQENAIKKLAEMQMTGGGFPWFSGSRYPNRFISQHVVTSFGHLKKLNVKIANKDAESIMLNAVAFLDGQIVNDYKKLLERAGELRDKASDKQEGTRMFKEFMERKQIRSDQIHYLYMRSLYADVPMDKEVDEISEYYIKQSGTYWREFNLYTKGMIALIHHRNKSDLLAKEILRSLKENSIVSEELGMYWKENKSGWYWHEAPVETQSLLIEAFSEIESSDAGISDKEKSNTIDELRVWLLKNKQTTSWKTTKATTEAIYALLLNGTNWLTLDDQVEATIGGKAVTPDSKEPETGTGYFKTTWKKEDINSGMSEVTLTKKDNGIAWGGVYWQYFEDLDKITPASTPLKLSKKVFIVSRTATGELLTEVNKGTPLKLGDLLRVRIELSTDREMEFLHMKDMRASGLEPVDVLSGYKWQEGLGYYQSTRDASTNFFFDSMQKGVYVFEYDLRVNNKGTFSNGITTIQSMYAPEFSSHSEGIRISVE